MLSSVLIVAVVLVLEMIPQYAHLNFLLQSILGFHKSMIHPKEAHTLRRELDPEMSS